MLGIVGFDALLIWVLTHRPVDGLSFVLGLLVLASVMAFGYLGYRTAGTFTMQYWVDRDAVTLIWGPTRQVIPIGQILCIQRNLAGHEYELAHPWHWPCPDRRRLQCDGVGIINSYATRPLDQQILLVTEGESYGISPADAEGFIRALQERYALGMARWRKTELQRPPLWTWRLWRDHTALVLIGAGLLGVLLMFGVFCFRLPGLSSDLPLHFDVNGLPDRIAPKISLIVLPGISLLAWLMNLVGGIWIYRRMQQQGAYLLWGGAVAVQVVAWFALLNVMRW